MSAADVVNRELARLGLLARPGVADGLVASSDGRLVVLDGGWFAAGYDPALLLTVLRRMKLAETSKNLWTELAAEASRRPGRLINADVPLQSRPEGS